MVNLTLLKLFKLPTKEDYIIYTDQGATSSKVDYCKELDAKRFNVSMSRRGNYWDNSPIKLFFNHFKSESIYLTKTKDYDSLISVIH